MKIVLCINYIFVYCIFQINALPIESTTILPQPETESEQVSKTEIPITGNDAKVRSTKLIEPEPKSERVVYQNIKILSLDSKIEDNGKYKYSFESDDGTAANQEGELKTIDSNHTGASVKGGYSYKDENGETINVTYTADENGFRPVGKHIPTIPPHISRALAYLATAKPYVDDNKKREGKSIDIVKPASKVEEEEKNEIKVQEESEEEHGTSTLRY